VTARRSAEDARRNGLRATQAVLAGPPLDSTNAEQVQQQLSGVVSQTSGAAIADAISGAITLGLTSGSTIRITPQSVFLGYAAQPNTPDPFAGILGDTARALAPSSPWSPWVDVRGSGLLGANGGQQLNVIGGLGYRFTEDFVAGVLGGEEWFNYMSTTPAGRLSSTGFSLGGYAGGRFAERGQIVKSSVSANASEMPAVTSHRAAPK
jgi:hypothetical protein